MNSKNKEWAIWRATFPVMVQSLSSWKDPYAGGTCERYLNSDEDWERIAARDAQLFFNNSYVKIDKKLELVQCEKWLYKYFTIRYYGLGKPTQTT